MESVTAAVFRSDLLAEVSVLAVTELSFLPEIHTYLSDRNLPGAEVCGCNSPDSQAANCLCESFV